MLVIIVLLLLLLYVTAYMPWRLTVRRDHHVHGDRIGEHFGSDYSNSFYGTSVWDGWPY